jgi:hypothetical protein
MKILKRKRIRKWDEILKHRFFSDKIGGFFTVLKAWNVSTFCKCAETSSGSHWFDHYTIKIKMDSGEILVIHKLPLDLEGVFNQNYDCLKIYKAKI